MSLLKVQNHFSLIRIRTIILYSLLVYIQTSLVSASELYEIAFHHGNLCRQEMVDNSEEIKTRQDFSNFIERSLDYGEAQSLFLNSERETVRNEIENTINQFGLFDNGELVSSYEIGVKTLNYLYHEQLIGDMVFHKLMSSNEYIHSLPETANVSQVMGVLKNMFTEDHIEDNEKAALNAFLVQFESSVTIWEMPNVFSGSEAKAVPIFGISAADAFGVFAGKELTEDWERRGWAKFTTGVISAGLSVGAIFTLPSD